MGPRLLVIDEIGCTPFGRDEADLLSNVVARRYERGSVILTSNLQATPGAATLAENRTRRAAMVDRLLHHAHIARIFADSYRFKD